MSETVVVTIWDKEGTETVLYVECTEYDHDDETIFLQGTIVADTEHLEHIDPDANKLIGRHVNVHLPID